MKINNNLKDGILTAVLNNGEETLYFDIFKYKSPYGLDMDITNKVAANFYKETIGKIHYECNARTNLYMIMYKENYDLHLHETN